MRRSRSPLRESEGTVCFKCQEEPTGPRDAQRASRVRHF